MSFTPLPTLLAGQQLTPWSEVQSASLFTGPGAVSFGALPTVGNLIIVAISSFSASIGAATVSDNQGNTYTRIPVGSVNDGGDDDVTLFYCIPTTSAGTFTITNTVGSSIAIFEYHCSLGTPVYLSDFSSTAVTPSSLSITSVPGNSMIFGAQSDADGGAFVSRTGFTTLLEEDDSSTHERLGTQHMLNPVPGTYTGGFSGPSGGAQASYVAAVFTVNAPGIALNSPANGDSVGSTTPAIDFTGLAAMLSQNIAYEVQIDTVNTFDSQGTAESLVQSTTNAQTTANNVTASLPSTVAGHMIIVAVYLEWGSGGTVSVSDGVNTYHQIVDESPDVSDFSLWYAYNIAGGNVTVTATTSAGTNDMGIIACEYAGLITTDPLDVWNAQAVFNSNSLNIDSGLTGFPTQDHELVIGAGESEGGSNTYTVGAGFGNLLVENSGTLPRDLALQDQIITYGAQQRSTMTLGNKAFWIGIVATFKLSKLPLIVAHSATDAGFADVPNSGDTSPFPSGDKIAYTVQSALTNGVTYYWRVRQMGVLGNPNYYGAWSATQSFTVSTGATPPNLFFAAA